VSVEALIFILRLLAGLCLFGFMLTLLVIVWRGMTQAERQLRAARTTLGFLTRQPPDSASAAEVFPLGAVTTLGRALSNNIVVQDDFASAEHARIVREEGRWWLEDRDSSNGTRLNEATIKERTALAHGDVIWIGSCSYRLALDSETVAPAP